MAENTNNVKREDPRKPKPTTHSSSPAHKPAPNGSTRPAARGVAPSRPAPARNAQPPTSTTPKPVANRPATHSPARPAGAPVKPSAARPASKPAPAAHPVAAKSPARPPAPPVAPAPPPPPKVVELPENLTVRDLAAELKVSPIDIIRKLMANGVMANINQPIDFDTAALVAGELGFEVKEHKVEIIEPEVVTLTSIPKKHEYTDAEAAELVLRPPVVTVMGHVDHGKTSVLDVIRHANVAEGEAGGITQHIGAYQIMHNGKRITFLDTPGHEAFTAMRARGAKATDIAIIVVAADDGVMPQTREAIDHARAAQVPIIVALNKIDKANANPERVKQQLGDMGLAVWGGKDEVTVVPISAKQKLGVDELLENILLVSELADLRANPRKPGTGIVIESKLDKQQGPMATLLVHEGTLHIGDAVLVGDVWGKIRAMFNDHGETVKEAGPATPVAVTGLADVPSAGETFAVVADERLARSRAEERALAKRQAEQKTTRAVSLNDLFAQFEAGNIKELNLIVKADVQGSLEPIVSSLEKLGYDKIKVKIIHQGIGTITRSDVMLAVASQGIVIGFNVGVEAAGQSLAESEGIDIREYNIIYKLIEDIDKALKGMLEPVFKDVMVGRAQVLQVFRMKKTSAAGLRVTQGKIVRNATARVLRGETELYKGPIASLKRFTEDVKEVAEGYECGLALEKFNDFQEGDQIEFYQKVRVS
ncbi:MAG: translation initiation factor IF-2 [Acidobacteriota bacterium]